MFGLDDIQRGNYFRVEPIRRTELEIRVGGSLRMERLQVKVRSLEIW